MTYRALESYGGTYKAHWPREQAETVRGLAKKSVFRPVHAADKGAVFGEAFGWERPLWFNPAFAGKSREAGSESPYTE